MADDVTAAVTPEPSVPGPVHIVELRSSMSDAWDNLAGGSDDAGAEAEETSEADVVADAPPDTDDIAGVDAAGADDEADDAAEAEGADEPSAEEPLDPPARYSQAQKAAFSKTSPDAQKLILEREHEMGTVFTQKMQAVSDRERRLATVEEALAPYKDQWALEGVEPGAFVTRLLKANDLLSDPASKTQGLRWLMQQIDVSLDDLVDLDTGDQSDPEISALRQKVSQLETVEAGRQQQAGVQEQQRIVRQIDAFQTAVDDQGELRHPHFEDVWQDMLQAVNGAAQMGQAVDLSEVYGKACWANPEVRAKLMQGRDQAATDERKARVARAKRAGRTARQAEPAAPLASELTHRQHISDIYDRMAGAA